MSNLALSPAGLAFRISRNPGRPWVVLTHGAFLDHEDLDCVADALSSRFQVLSWDLPGHGRSRLPLSSSMNETAGELARLIDHVGIERYWLIGHSYGGMISQALISLRPGNVLGFVAYGCVALHLSRIPFKALVIRLDRWLSACKGPARLAEEFARACSTDVATREHMRRHVCERIRALRPPIWESMLRAAHWWPEYRFPCPVGHIRGERDTRFPGGAEAMAAFAASLGMQNTVVLPELGHCAHHEDPAAFNLALLRMLGKLDADISNPELH